MNDAATSVAATASPRVTGPGDPTAAGPRSDARVSRETRVFTARVYDDWTDLQALEPAWKDLADNALEPSPSAEPWMLVPSLRHGIPGRNVRVLAIFASSTEPTLCGVFPLEEQSRHRGLPVRIIRLWSHIYSLFPAPLLRRDCAAECLRTFFDWVAATQPARTLVEFPELRADSAFFGLLTELLARDSMMHLVTNAHVRAFFRPKADAERYLNAVGTAHHRKEWRRQERRLSERGVLGYDSLEPSGDVQKWIDEFIELEMTGWKGREGTAFGAKASHRAWLEHVLRTAADRRQLMMLALRLDGRAVAMKLNLLAPPGSYAFKIAYDEGLSKFSPGVLLELENIKRLHSDTRIEWMDSLAGPGHPLIDRLWTERMPIVSLLIAPGRYFGKILLSSLPLLRTLKQCFPAKLRG